MLKLEFGPDPKNQPQSSQLLGGTPCPGRPGKTLPLPEYGCVEREINYRYGPGWQQELYAADADTAAREYLY